MRWQTIGYVVACVVAPVAWGLFIVWTSGRIEKWIGRRNAEQALDRADVAEPHPIDYHI